MLRVPLERALLAGLECVLTTFPEVDVVKSTTMRDRFLHCLHGSAANALSSLFERRSAVDSASGMNQARNIGSTDVGFDAPALPRCKIATGSMWSRSRALAGLREVASKATNGVGVRDVQRLHSNDLYLSLLHHFGSFEAAREAANVPAPPLAQQFWNEQLVIEELQKAHRAGIRLTIKGLSAAGMRGLANAARDYCGGLPRARRLARVPDPA
ncbi:MAG: hypothetical protein ACRENC_18595, partial [Gemmatimonadaceae bacterium]